MAKDAAGSPPTLEMVARVAGVSRATVSRVVNGSPKVSPDIVEAVNAAVAELRYVPNRAARSLARRSSNAIALVVPEDVTWFFSDPYFATIVKGITSRVDDSEFVLNLLVASNDPHHKTLRYLNSGVVDGAIVISHHVGDAILADTRPAVPLVFGGRPALESGADDYFVDVDNRAAAAAGTRYLIERGHRRIGSITGPVDMPAGIDRLDGYLDAVRGAGLGDELFETADFTAAGAALAARRLLDRVGTGPGGALELDALFVASDLMATGVIAELRERGLRVPDDIAVVGFDDSPAALTGPVPLTTVAQPSEAAGAAMADVLLRLLAGDDAVPRATILPTELVVRESA